MTRLHFASGSNTPSDIRGFDFIGHPIGVAAPELREAALSALEGVSVPVFVDSGAFSEIEFTAAGPVVVRPLGREDWLRIFAIYERLGRALGPQLSVVACDRIGDQGHSLSLLREHAGRLARIASLGVTVLVPMQRGHLSQAEFYRAVEQILPFAWVPAIPAKKNATSPAEFAAFVAAIRPARCHMLGLGLKNRQIGAFLAAGAGTDLTFDSNIIKANVGRTNGLGRGPRRLTAARDRAQEMIASGLAPVAFSQQELGIILAFGDDHDAARVVTIPAAA